MKKKLLVLIIASILFIPNVFASTKTYKRTESNNYLVNKKWNITDKNKKNVLNAYAVDSKELVYDFADLLTDLEEQMVYELFVDFKDKYNMDIVFYSDTFKSDDDDDNINRVVDFYDYNDFGIDYEHYDGVIIYRNIYGENYYAFRAFGKAQLYFNSSRLDKMKDVLYDNFHYKKYLKGIKEAEALVRNCIDSGIPKENKDKFLDENNRMISPYKIPYVIGIIVSGIATTITLSIMVSKNKMVKKAHEAGDYEVKDKSVITDRKDRFLHTHTSSYTVSSSSGGGGGGHIGSSGGGSVGCGGRG